MNKVILMGRLVRDPELRQVRDGLSVVGFSIAVDRKFKSANSDVTVDFVNCTAFSKTAEFVAKWFKKGNRILLVGRLQQDMYTNKEGQKVNTYSVIAEEVEFCESKASADSYNASPSFNDNFMDPNMANIDDFSDLTMESTNDNLPF